MTPAEHKRAAEDIANRMDFQLRPLEWLVVVAVSILAAAVALLLVTLR